MTEPRWRDYTARTEPLPLAEQGRPVQLSDFVLNVKARLAPRMATQPAEDLIAELGLEVLRLSGRAIQDLEVMRRPHTPACITLREMARQARITGYCTCGSDELNANVDRIIAELRQSPFPELLPPEEERGDAQPD